ncbi:hypothetical protein [Mumia sp. DW29H23]|uniref:hypothetical protein n=1 Tax=Mumia sp. DW29H23 TaxID=3421241 RepID=UPI003D6800F3
MPRLLVLFLGVVGGAVVAVAGLVVVRSVVGMTTLGVDQRTLACGTESGPAQVCVVRLSRPELLVVPGRHEIQVRRTGVPRALYADDPFGAHTPDDALDVDLGNGNGGNGGGGNGDGGNGNEDDNDGGVVVRGPAFTLRWTSDEVDSLLTD